ncbi:hypothetical protein Kpol_2000p49 [Vanderwaltozyma polyspora DSM 70294]|uniref:Retrograde transport protein Dsl1 C-terminal domain-containing protein n=1 Tax=Vanderwaltozyma polyspora (strain ATCC 22028 / DSM 70294 / BCRC 21397 / CBS 2163 / NBRC 10782 / NRRL Y-8283 / UCD 57-17) TaxID=436907 RepID=A7TF57_VANPO|nr:uncharacterized protein Kpol_2000p49 [Vanderwaltozyma polyspora DSM 70294]EDO19082.1 hypothetical protein Kpol_2000p49 [Vanderwaltozyma polyspora DSM 70294]
MSVTNPVASFVADKERLLQLLRNDPLLSLNDDVEITEKIDLEGLLKLDASLTEELHVLNSLKTIPSLILEFKANMEYLELENCYYSLQNLRKKLKENDTLVRQNIRLQQSVATYVDSLHVQLVDKLFDLISNHFWNFKEHTISHKDEIVYGKDKVKFDYETLLEFVNRDIFPQNVLDFEHWLIKDMVMGDLQEIVRERLSTIVKSYILFDSIIHDVKENIFNDKGIFTYDEDSKKLSLVDSRSKDLDLLTEKLVGFGKLADYLLSCISKRDVVILSSRIGPSIAKESHKLIKENISSILQEQSTSIKNLILELNDKLLSLSNATNGVWNYSGNETEELLNDKQIYNNLLLDKIFEEQVNRIRNIFVDDTKQWSKLTEIESFKTTNKTESTHLKISQTRSRRSSRASRNSKVSEEQDDWGWDGAEDSWDTEGDNTDVKRRSRAASKVSFQSGSNVDDGWDEEWDIDIDEVDEKTNSASQKLHITQLPSLFKMIVNDFEISCKELGDGNVDPQYKTYKFNLLQTLFMAIAIRNFPNNIYQLYIDIRYITTENNSLDRLNELNYRLMENQIALKEKYVNSIIQNSLGNLERDEKDIRWRSQIKDLVPFIQCDIINPLISIGNPDSEKFILKFLNFLFNNCITSNILNWKIISEKNSNNLSEFISLVLNASEVPSIETSPKYREIREKFIIIGKLLPLHLKDIMQMFYDGDFYLFSTEEIVQWIVLLFADTPLRRNAIDDINEIRKETLD